MSNPPASDSEIREVLLETYAVNDRMNQLLLEDIDQRGACAASRAEWERRPDNRGHLCHMHNNRLVWVLVWFQSLEGRSRPRPSDNHGRQT